MRNILVTGATRGLGFSIATTLAAGGDRVIAVARLSNGSFEAAVESVRKSGSGAIEFQPFDLSNINDIGALVRNLRTRFGALYGLVNNAGIGTHGVLATMRNSDIEKLVCINTVAPMVLTKYVVRHMMADGAGRIINISSIVGFTGYKAMSAYAASKASMIGFTRSLAREVGAMGICVNAVAPGFVATDMTGELGAVEMQQIVRRSALRRLADANDVAKTVEFLLSEGARNITGTIVTVDAGNTA